MSLEIKMLVVDDEELTRSLLEKYFVEKGMEVKTTSSGKEALKILPLYKPNIILSDIMMPEMDGVTLLKEIKKILPLTKVMMMTAIRDEKLYHECMEQGAEGFIIKPFQLFNLDALIFGKLLT